MKKKITAFFKKNPNNLYKSRQLIKKLEIITEPEYESLKSHLHSLYEEGVLERIGKRYKLKTESTGKSKHSITGIFEIMRDGNGILQIDDENKTGILIRHGRFGCAFPGDLVDVEIAQKSSGKKNEIIQEGQVLKVLNRNRSEYSGTLNKAGSFYYLIPDLPEIYKNIYISNENLNGAVSGDKVVVDDLVWDDYKLNPEGKVKEVLGKSGSHDVEVISIAKEFKLPYKFNNETLHEAENIPESIDKAEIKNRVDFRNKKVFTIDPDDAKDFDDALSLEMTESGNMIVGIHIADVSHYVQPKSNLDNEAQKRGNSVYLVGKVIPMLPEKLSNRICSLVPGEDRLTYSVIAELTPRGKVVNYKIEKTIINSKRRFSYEEAQKVIETGEGDLVEDILALNKLAKILRQKRMSSGSINFFSEEIKFKLDEKGTPVEVYRKEIKESNNLIEEYMLLANKLVAEFILSKKKNKEIVPFVYRIHDRPDKEKMKEFARFVKSLGFIVNFSEAPTTKQINALMEMVKGKAEETLVNELAIRSMAKAIYSTENIGHYGLGFANYSHFTSPIRRYSDLLVHRILFSYLSGKKGELYQEKALSEICTHLSATERNAMDAERLSVKLKHMQYLTSYLGYEFNAIISGVTNFGIFVKLTDNLAEGLIHVRDLSDDYYIFDEKNYAFIGRGKGNVYRLGDKITVKLVKVSQEKKQIDFKLSRRER